MVDLEQAIRDLVRENRHRLPEKCPICDGATKIIAEGLVHCEECDAFFDYEVKTHDG